MAFLTLASLVVLAMAFWQSNVCAIEPNEPTCLSRFDYDEKMLLKLLRMEQEIETFRRIVEEFKMKEAELDVKRQEDYKMYETAKIQLNIESETMKTDFNNSLAELTDKMNSLEADLTKDVKQSSEVFTVKKPETGPDSDEIAFEKSVLIEGSGYDMSTGKFTCTTPGLYQFSVYIVKLRSTSSRVDLVGCYICKNGYKIVRAHIDPDDGADLGSYGVANAAYIRLNSGDVVNLCGCDDAARFDEQSSFSGRLIERE